jgi:hypothetical protein
MPLCPHCKHFNPTTALYCGRCDVELENPARPLVAPPPTNKGFNWTPPVKSKQSLNPNLVFGGGVLVMIVLLVLLFQNHKSSGPDSNSSSTEKGHWVTHCRNVQVRNPNYSGGSSTSVNHNLSAGPAFTSQRQCTDQFVNP